jgi:hypothetical protein
MTRKDELIFDAFSETLCFRAFVAKFSATKSQRHKKPQKAKH